MKSLNIMFVLAITAAFVFTGCKKDKENPTVTVSSPAEHTEFAKGAEVHIDATFADDLDLASYTMEVGDVNGDHIMSFHHDESGSISGTSHHLHTMVTVPDTFAMSMFYLHFTVTDAAGKTGSLAHMLHVTQ